MRPPGSPRRGDLAGSNTSEPRGSAPRERDHRGGDHPVPSRTRQLSPPSPRVLQREAAGGQGVALAEGAFLYAPREARGGDRPLRAFARFGRGCGPTSGVARAAGALSRRGAPAGRVGLRYALEAGFLSLCTASRFSFLLVPKRLINGYNFRTMYSSLAQCWCMGMRDL